MDDLRNVLARLEEQLEHTSRALQRVVEQLESPAANDHRSTEPASQTQRRALPDVLVPYLRPQAADDSGLIK